MTAPARFRQWLLSTAARPSTRAALALTVVGVLFALVELQSPSRLYWTGDAVAGTNSGGIVYYRVGGEEFTVTAPGDGPARDTPVTVYVDPDDPGTALLSRPTRWLDAAAVLGWFLAAGGCLGVAALRRASSSRRHEAGESTGPTFGDGLSADLLHKYLDQNRQPPRRPPSS